MNETVLNVVRSAHYDSVCSQPCGLRQATRYSYHQTCCWTCTNCTTDQIIINQLTSISQVIRPISTICAYCPAGHRPELGMNNCRELPTTYMSKRAPEAIVVTAICLLCLCLSLIVAVIFLKNWNTPVVRASGRETSAVLLIAITLAYVMVILVVSDKPSRVRCIMTIVAPGWCTTLAYAAIFARINRIDRLFSVCLLLMKHLMVLIIDCLHSLL